MEKSFDMLLPLNFLLLFSKRENHLQVNQYINPLTFPFPFFAHLLLTILQFGHDLSVIQHQNYCIPYFLNANFVSQHK